MAWEPHRVAYSRVDCYGPTSGATEEEVISTTIGTFRNWPRSDQQPVITKQEQYLCQYWRSAHSVFHYALRSLASSQPHLSTLFIYSSITPLSPGSGGGSVG